MPPGQTIRKYCVQCVGSMSDVRKCKGDKLLDGTICPFFKYRMGTGRPSVKVIRKFCVQCMNGSFELVENCPSKKCLLYPYRFGKSPAFQAVYNRLSEEEKRKRINRAKHARKSIGK